MKFLICTFLILIVAAIVLLIIAPIFALIPFCLLVAYSLFTLIMIGKKGGVGPFKKLFNFDDEVDAIVKRYDADKRKGETVFYGASNFTLWKEMDEDLAPYKIQNHGFGGSTDKFLVKYADRLLYPYEPNVVFFQTGSNDYVLQKGTDSEKVEECMSFKDEMFSTFHEKLPAAKFVVMSGLLLPKRSQFLELTKTVNKRLKEYCEKHSDFMSFVDAEEMTYDGEKFGEELFRKDGIHLNHEGQLKWRDEYIMPVLKKLSDEKPSV